MAAQSTASRGAARNSGKRRRILEAAQELFGEVGFEAARMEEIARRAEVSKGTLYNFFDSKEDLLICAVEQAMQDGVRTVTRAVGVAPDTPGSELRARLRSLFVEVLPLVTGGPNVLYQQVWSLAARDPVARERVFAHLREFYRAREAQFEATIREGAARGELRDDVDPGEVGQLLLAIFDGLVRRASFDEKRVGPERALDTLLALLDSGLSARPAADRP